MSHLSISNQQAFSPRTILMKLLPTLIYAAVLPYLIYMVAHGSLHLSEVDALLLAAVPQVFGVLVELVSKRRLSLIGSMALIGMAVKLASALLVSDARLVLISDSLMIGVYGLILLGSVLIGKPLLVVLIKSGSGERSPEQRALMEQGLHASGLHRRLLFLTTMWGVGLLLTPVVGVLLVYALPIAEVVLLRPVIDYGIVVILVGISMVYGRIVRARQQQQSAR
ncbi:MAG: hypothetical protein J2P37_19400 [Ktedonobacteraceae bacterium]|nr:hypothetical protein [Ktedonobacteraceae bacterium]